MKEVVEKKPIIISESEFQGFAGFVETFPNANPDLRDDLSKRIPYWKAMYAFIDEKIIRNELTRIKGEDLKAKATAIRDILAMRDSLTGLLRHGEWEQRFAEVYADSKRNNRPFAAIMADVNRLKVINDQEGHSAGDRALRKVAKTIAESIRDEDFPGRTGGDEFRIGCVNCDLSGAREVAQRIKESLVGKVTVSIGVGEMGIKTGESPESFIERVDRASYQAKKRSQQELGISHIVISRSVLTKG